jgi:hypothetical protein
VRFLSILRNAEMPVLTVCLPIPPPSPEKPSCPLLIRSTTQIGVVGSVVPEVVVVLFGVIIVVVAVVEAELMV